MLRSLALLVLALSLAACGDDDVNGNQNPTPNGCFDDGCTTNDLPFTGGTDFPTVTNVTLECQSQSVVVLATVSDPQGTANLLNVIQTVGVYPDADCVGTSIDLQDDLAGSGLEESFGDAVLAASNQTLYDQICSCAFWPVTVRFTDLDGNVTTGRVAALVTD